MHRIPANKLKQLKNNTNHLIENDVYQVTVLEINFYVWLSVGPVG